MYKGSFCILEETNNFNCEVVNHRPMGGLLGWGIRSLPSHQGWLVAGIIILVLHQTQNQSDLQIQIREERCINLLLQSS
jgi:hypothetical protein